MPIKPENRHRYPENWPEIRAAILERAGHRCEHRDAPAHRCGAGQYAVGTWRCGVFLPIARTGRTYAEARQNAAEASFTLFGDELPTRREDRIIVIVLTIAHLDHRPENCDPSNLRALCQRHHLAHDHAHHMASAQATRRAKSGTGELFA